MAAAVSKFMSFAFDPIYHWVAFTILLFFLIAFHRNSSFKVITCFMIYMGTVVLTPFPASLVSFLEERYQPVLSPPEKGAIVILSGGTVEFNTRTGQYSWYGRDDRILEPLRIWVRSKSLFIISGKEMSTEGSPIYLSETESMGKLAQEFGVPKEQIVLERDARSTRENARNVKRILEEKGITDFYLVTSAFHMERAMQSFHDLNLRPTAFQWIIW